jgi:hypothetical protein
MICVTGNETIRRSANLEKQVRQKNKESLNRNTPQQAVGYQRYRGPKQASGILPEAIHIS